MPAHTPGPWHVGNAHGAARDHAICVDHQVIARVTGSGFPIGKGWSAETAANARLIAAAPDLLAALIQAEASARVQAATADAYADAGRDVEANRGLAAEHRRWADVYRAAIAEATGGGE